MLIRTVLDGKKILCWTHWPGALPVQHMQRVGVTSRRTEPTVTIALRQDFVLRRLDGSVTYQVTPVSPESANAQMPSDMRSLL